MHSALEKELAKQNAAAQNRQQRGRDGTSLLTAQVKQHKRDYNRRSQNETKSE
jgi:hypothetical protein